MSAQVLGAMPCRRSRLHALPGAFPSSRPSALLNPLALPPAGPLRLWRASNSRRRRPPLNGAPASPGRWSVSRPSSLVAMSRSVAYRSRLAGQLVTPRPCKSRPTSPCTRRPMPWPSWRPISRSRFSMGRCASTWPFVTLGRPCASSHSSENRRHRESALQGSGPGNRCSVPANHRRHPPLATCLSYSAFPW